MKNGLIRPLVSTNYVQLPSSNGESILGRIISLGQCGTDIAQITEQHDSFQEFQERFSVFENVIKVSLNSCYRSTRGSLEVAAKRHPWADDHIVIPLDCL